MKSPITVVDQGKAVAEPSEGGWFLMLPDGSVSWWPDKRSVEYRVRLYARRHLPKKGAVAGALTIEWRGL